MVARVAPEERFRSKYDRGRHETDCWLWNAGQDRLGYGKFLFYGKHQSASRTSWMIHVGPIPQRLCVLHRCDVRACVNPSHLFLGTVKDNATDMVAKGRSTCGERNAGCKISEPDVLAIRKMHGRVTNVVIGKRFGITNTQVRKIANGCKWSHLLNSEAREEGIR